MGGRQSGSKEWQVFSLGSRTAENSEAVGKRAAAGRKANGCIPWRFSSVSAKLEDWLGARVSRLWLDAAGVAVLRPLCVLRTTDHRVTATGKRRESDGTKGQRKIKR